jgi:hypothetical protein
MYVNSDFAGELIDVPPSPKQEHPGTLQFHSRVGSNHVSVCILKNAIYGAALDMPTSSWSLLCAGSKRAEQNTLYFSPT